MFRIRDLGFRIQGLGFSRYKIGGMGLRVRE